MQLCDNHRVPKVVDHQARREDIARAVWRLIARGGTAAATVRAVAAESGWSMGTVRHYFDSQAQLLRFAAEEMMRRVPPRLAAVLASMAPGPDRAMALLEQLLPLDEERRVECTIWLTCLVDARADQAYDDLRMAAWDGERYVCRYALSDILAVAAPTHLHDQLVDAAEAMVDALHAHLDGLTMMGTLMPERATATWLRVRLREQLAATAGPTG
jgi:AcrR family transcriptional regulator